MKIWPTGHHKHLTGNPCENMPGEILYNIPTMGTCIFQFMMTFTIPTHGFYFHNHMYSSDNAIYVPFCIALLRICIPFQQVYVKFYKVSVQPSAKLVKISFQTIPISCVRPSLVPSSGNVAEF